MTNLITKQNITLAKLGLLILVLFSSCASRKDFTYFQDELLKNNELVDNNRELVYSTDDLITIDVNSLDPLASQPFNLPAVSYGDSFATAQGTLRMQTYLIDKNGNIEFPVLGTLKLGGLSRSAATNYLKERLSEYIKDPIVNIRLTNFTISVLGDVNRPGTYTIQDERISIPEALGLAGDLTNTGLRSNILLIREVNGEKRFAKLDLTSVNIVNSPVYYLAQNDVIYVESNNAKIKSSSYNPNTAVVISAISTLATIAAILIR